MNEFCNKVTLLVVLMCVGNIKAYLDPDVCIGQEHNALLPHPDSCELMIVCDNEVPQEGACPPNMIFDPETRSCVFGECEDLETTTTPTSEETTTTTDDPNIEPGIVCPEGLGPNELFFIPSKISCDRYYFCMNSRPMLMMCREGLHWNSVLNKCDFPENVKCTITQPGELPSCNGVNMVYLPHPTDCHLYIFCIDGQRKLQQCQHNRFWDHILQDCVRQDRVNCYNGA